MPKKVLLLILISYFLLLLVGLTSELCLGDEVHHYRFAKLIYKTGKIVAQDPLYSNVAGEVPYLFLTPPLWHILLVILWKLTGGISPYIAQIYHGIYYALLILFTYLLAKTLYTDQDGWYSAIIIATCPAVISFSILFYMDLPLTTFTTLCFLLLFKKRYFLAGLVLGLMYLIKMNSAFFIPIFLILIFYFTKDKIIEKIKRLFCFFTISLIGFAIYDICWRNKNFSNYFVMGGFGNLNKIILERMLVAKNPFNFFEYTNSSFRNPIDLVKYLGLILLISLILYFVFKKYEKRDKLLWISVGIYILLFIFIFVASDIRY
ncbi:MAG: glycosyltransferase family 39 protein, partial [Candidatus Omnitrophota bacterium]